MKRGALILILILVLIIAIIALVGGYIYMQLNREPDIPDNALLAIPLSGQLVDQDTSPLGTQLTLRDLFFHLQRARIDPRIRGLLLRISWCNASPALMEDIGKLIRDFRESGKPVHAYMEGGGLKEYLMASFANSISVMPGGDLFLKNYASEALFIRGTLDKLGIQAEFFQFGEYKTAAHIYTRKKMTPAHRESLTQLLEDIRNATITAVSQNRNLPVEKISTLINELPLSNEAYLKGGLIDFIRYEDQVVTSITPALRIVPFERYNRTAKPNPFHGNRRIAILFAGGEIHPGSGGGKSIFGNPVLGASTLVAQIRALRKRKSVKAVVLRIDSPGGSAVASESIRRELERLVEEKPLVVSMAGVAASGGYWISMPATRIFALPETVTGSIGVLGGKFINRDFYSKIGISKELVETGNYAGMFSDYRPFTAAEKEKFIFLLKRTYDRFIHLVSKSRRISLQEAEQVARGRVWSGDQARRLNLIDASGGLLDALSSARELAGISVDESFALTILPRKKSLIDLLFSLSGVNADATSRISAVFQRYRRFFPATLLPFQLHFQ